MARVPLVLLRVRARQLGDDFKSRRDPPEVADDDAIVGRKAGADDAQVADLKAGKWYINLHTAANPGGELRGQVN